MRKITERKKAQPKHAGCARKPARVLIVDDHPLMRKGIRALIDVQPDFVCCGEASSVNEVIKLLDRSIPDLIVADISLPHGSGIDLIRDIKVRCPNMPILVLSMHDEMLYAERVLRAGAGGYVMKHEPPERLMEGLRTVLNGELFVSRRLAGDMMNAFVRRSPRSGGRHGMELLSIRELQVLEGIGAGMSTRQIGQRYSISPKTVETYRLHIKRKLNLVNGNDLVHAAVRLVEGEAAGLPASMRAGAASDDV